MSSPVFRIAEDNPGRRMHLISTSGPSYRWLRWLAGPLLVAIPLATGTIFYQVFGQPFAVLVQQDPGTKFTVGFVLILLTVMVLSAMQFVGKAVARATSYVSEVRGDSNTGQFEILRRGWLWWLNGKDVVALDRVKRLVLTTGPLDEIPPLLELEIEYLTANDLDSFLVVRGRIERIEDRQSAVEWAFRVGQIAQLAGYRIRRNDEQDLEVVLMRKRSANSKLEPLPSTSTSGKFVLPLPQDVVAHAQSRAKLFKPESLEGHVTFTKIVDWQPGKKVHFVREAIPREALVVLGVLAGGLGAVLGAFPIYEALNGVLFDAPRWGYALAIGTAADLMAMYVAVTRFRHAEAIFDWGRHEVHLIDGRHHTHVAFNHLEGLLLRGVRRASQVGSSSRRRAQRLADYRTRLELLIPRGNFLLIETDEYESSPISAQRRLTPLTQELASALNQTWHWEDYDRGTVAVRQERWRLRPIEMVFLLLIGLGMASFFTLRGQTRRANERAFNAVAQTGVDISFSNGYTFHDLRLAEDYWLVDFRERGNDDFVRRVAEPLQQLPRVSVELTHSPITDEAVATLAKVPGLQILFVSLTAVSDRGIVQLAEAERLVMLGATRTRITDASLAEIAKLPRLRVLLVGFNNITDEGLRYLKDCPALEWVHVVNTQVTPEGIAELQQARPHLHIEH